MNSNKSAGRIHFVANCLYGTHIAGGDIHFFQLALGAIKAGFQLHFFGGHALAYHLQKQEISATQTVTDSRILPRINAESLGGQLRLLWDYIGRFFRTICNLGKIQKDDFAYAVTDYWFDALPVIFCRAHRKVMVWHMQAPSLKEIIFRTRADVDAKRLASLYFWASQNLTLWLFCRCANKRLIYINPCMRGILLAKGYREEEISHVSFGVTVENQSRSSVKRDYDVVWLGRLHRQKGIEDLLATLDHLAKGIPDFRALIIGNVKMELRPRLDALGLANVVDTPGFVSEEEKWRLFHASRVFLMPSRFEGAPRVIGEALLCGLRVIAYDLDNYRFVFRDLVQYAPSFDLSAFQRIAKEQVVASRNEANPLSAATLEEFRIENSWDLARQVFLNTLRPY